jgi:molecular chaperone GrpE
VVRAILPVVDHMELALLHAGNDREATGLAEGVELIMKQFRKTLAGLGLTPLEISPGDAFDPQLHEAMLKEVDPQIEVNHIARALRTGYMLGDRLLRAARVAVSVEPTGEPSTVAPVGDREDRPQGTAGHPISARDETDTVSDEDDEELGEV